MTTTPTADSTAKNGTERAVPAEQLAQREDDTASTSPEPTQEMAGFDEFSDIVDYIEKTTSWIWDFKNPGLIYRFYTPLTLVHTSDGDTFGRDTVIENSIKKMAAFPDIKDHVQDTIWTGNDRDGYLTSMRWTWIARNTGHSIYGPPTNKRVVCSGIANCVVKGENIIEEWVVYNEISLLRQVGIGVGDYLRGLGEQGARVPDATGEVDRLVGQGPPEELEPLRPGAPFDIADFVRRGSHDVWNRRMMGDLGRYYAPNAVVHSASDRELYGVGDVMQDVLGWVAMLPDCRRQVDELYWNEERPGRYRVATRWTLAGTHTGQSRYGAPTGRRVRILGITHQIVEHGHIVEEWSEYSELDLIKQLRLPLADVDF